jgi:hypothetical protein
MWDLKVPFGTGGDSDYDERGTDSTIAVVLVVRDIIDVPYGIPCNVALF